MIRTAWLAGILGVSTYACSSSDGAGSPSGFDDTDGGGASAGYGGFGGGAAGYVATGSTTSQGGFAGNGTPPPATCGNSAIDTGEQCDGANLNGETCASATLNAQPIGSVGCFSNCTIDTSGCSTNGGGGTSGSGGTSGTGGGVGTGGGGLGGTTGSGGTTSNNNGTAPTMLPTPKQTCPNIVTGTVNFLGSAVTVWAGPASKPNGPLLLYWHATGTNSQEVVSAFGQGAINDVTTNGGMIASFTTTTGTGTNTGNNVWYTGDFDVADEVVACAIQQLHIDTSHIHSAGYSAGGLQTGTMSYLRSGYLASTVIYSGGAILTNPDQDPSNVPALLCNHGAPGSDVLVLDFANGCTTLETAVKQRGGFAADCNDGGSHIDVGKRFAVAAQSWQFLLDHPYNVNPEPYSGGLPSTFPSYCSIP